MPDSTTLVRPSFSPFSERHSPRRWRICKNEMPEIVRAAHSFELDGAIRNDADPLFVCPFHSSCLGEDTMNNPTPNRAISCLGR